MAKATCSEPGCAEPVHGRGLCNTHYRRWRRDQGLERSAYISSRTCSVSGCDGAVHGNDLCSMHDQRRRKRGRLDLPSPDERFDALVTPGPLATNRPDLGPCHDWLGRSDAQGYGIFGVDYLNIKAHIYAFERMFGPVPLQGEGAPFPTRRVPLDHFACDRPICCNPTHVRISTPRENVLRSLTAPPAINARKTHCKRGHALTGDNLHINRKGERVCRACQRYLRAKYRAEAKRSAADADAVPVDPQPVKAAAKKRKPAAK